MGQNVSTDNDYGQKLGQGGFGAVYKTNKNGKVMAVKVIQLKSPRDVQAAQREASILLKVKGHKNIIRIESVDYEESTVLIYMEFCDHGDLESYMRTHQGSLSFDQMVKFLKQLVDAVDFIHSKRIIHRDIKPQNILMKTEAGDVTVKLADFGIGNVAATMGYFQTWCGSPSYMAPEVRPGQKYTFSADVYSMGMVFRKVMQNCDDCKKKEDILKLAKEMVYEDPKLRCSLSEVKKTLQNI